MEITSLQSYHVNRGRMAVLLLASFSLVVLVPWAVFSAFPDLPVPLRIASVAVGFVAYGAAFTLGMRYWAAARFRYELNAGGLSVFGASGQLRERVPWGDVRTYVVDTPPSGANVRFLTITRRQGPAIRLVEGKAPGAAQAFQTFFDAFLAAVADRGSSLPLAVPIQQGTSFYDGAAGHALGILLLVLMAVLTVGSFFLPADSYTTQMRMRLVVCAIISAPFIYRTVFNRRKAG